MTLTAIKEYYSSNIHKPFFSVVGNDEYRELKINLEELEIDFIRLSDCCHNQDKKPDLDILREKLRTADIDCKCNRVAVLGWGGNTYYFVETVLQEWCLMNLKILI